MTNAAMTDDLRARAKQVLLEKTIYHAGGCNHCAKAITRAAAQPAQERVEEYKAMIGSAKSERGMAEPNAAPQSSTADLAAASSHEDVGQGGTADAALSDTPETDAIEKACSRDICNAGANGIILERVLGAFLDVSYIERERNRLREELAESERKRDLAESMAANALKDAFDTGEKLAALQKRIAELEAKGKP